jgi:DNA polymerase III subunit epsilon
MAEQTSDADHLTAFASDAAIIIAHNAAFDRKFAERYWPVFAVKPWACSVNQIEWRAHGPFSSADRTALSLLLENARRKTIRIWAEHAPFDLKDNLKQRRLSLEFWR